MEGLEHETDVPGAKLGPLVFGKSAQVEAVQQHAPVGWPIEPGEQPEQRGLAAPGGAQDRDDLLGFDTEVDLVQHGERAAAARVGLGKLLRDDHHSDVNRMKRTALLLTLAWLAACGPADDAGSARSGSTGDAASPPPAASPDGAVPDSTARPRVVFLGTSLTAGLGLTGDGDRFTDRLQQMADSAGIPVSVVNGGLSGDTSAGGLRRLDWLLQQHADVLVVELGANDGLRGQSVDAMKANLEQVIERAEQLSPGVRVVLVGMEAPPNLGSAYTSSFRAVFRDLAREHDLPLVPFLLEGVAGVPSLNQSDRIHPTAEGHRKIAEMLWPHLEPVFRDAAAAAEPTP
jgi:acyl-CoA thioesterase-1